MKSFEEDWGPGESRGLGVDVVEVSKEIQLVGMRVDARRRRDKSQVALTPTISYPKVGRPVWEWMESKVVQGRICDRAQAG